MYASILSALTRLLRFQLVVGFFGIATVMGCGPKPTPFTVDAPEMAYERGKRFLEAGQHERAAAEFERARTFDANYAPAYEGLSRVALAQGRITDAIRDIRMAKLKDPTYAPAWIGTGLLYDSAKRYDDAITEYQEALKRDSDGLWAKITYYHLGQAYLHLGQLDRARDSFASALALDPLYLEADQAMAQMAEQHPGPGGAATNIPSEYSAIPSIQAITRGELAAVFARELPLQRLITHPPTSAGKLSKDALIIDDIKGHWAKRYIQEVAALRVMDVYPDHTFKPQGRVTRVALALAIQNLMVAALNDPGLATAYVGHSSPFPDVPSTHYAYNAVTLVTIRGIMLPKSKGMFGPNDPVSGAEALAIVRALRDRLK